jgi:hypothetical protein
VQLKVIENLIIYMVAIECMYCQLVLFSLLYCIDGQDELDISLCTCSTYDAFDDDHGY